MNGASVTSGRSSRMRSACAGKVGGDVGEHVDADEVAEPEGAGFRPAERRAGEGVDLFDGQPLLHHQADGVAHREGADAVGDEVRLIERVDDRFAQPLVAEVRDDGDVVRIGRGGGNDFEQPHVARRIEEVGAKPMLLQVFVEASHDFRDGKSGGVGGSDGAGFTVLEHLGEQRAFDLKVFGDDFDNPVTAGDQRHIVVEVAEGDEAGGIRGEEGCRLGLLEAVEGAQHKLVARGLGSVGGGAGRDDIEQHDGHAGVGDVGGDARTHGSGAEDGDFGDLAQVGVCST